MSFPLYDTFARSAATMKELTNEQKKKLIDNIKLLDQDGLDKVYLIIRYAAQLENDDTVFTAKYQKKGVVFNLDAFSDDLQKIIWAFVEKHLTETAESQGPVDIIFQ